MVAAITVPVMLPIPPNTTISKISKVRVKRNMFGSMVVKRLAKNPPPHRR